MQFYLFLPFIVGLLVAAAQRMRNWLVIPSGIALLAALSFGYSIIETAANPDAAYFNPGTRAWEFLAGAVLASVYPFLRTRSPRLAGIWQAAAAVALLTLISFGIWSGDSPQFPGWIAVMPVWAAVVLILAGRDSGEPTLATQLLSHPTLVYLGGFSFTIYLWHWPLLVFAQHHFGSTTLTIWQGLIVIATSIALAALTKRFVEDPTRTAPSGKKGTRRTTTYLAIAALLLGVGVAGRQAVIAKGSEYLAQLEQPTATTPDVGPPDEVMFPLMRYVTVDYDRPRGINCLNGNHCNLGDKDSDRLIVMIGDSHTAQWVDAADHLGQELGYRIETYLNQTSVSNVIERQPEAVITVATKTTPSHETEPETVRVDQFQNWERLSDAGISILGIRDNPRFGFYQNACIWQNRKNPNDCSLARDEVLVSENPSEIAEDTIEKFHPIDLTPFFCSENTCPSVTDESFIYYDKHHMTRTHVNAVSVEFVNQVLAQAPGALSMGR
ncbi:acyltransferase [Dietzia kunjamensis]|nr:acyltransferase [Dietzia kunjamensis]